MLWGGEVEATSDAAGVLRLSGIVAVPLQPLAAWPTPRATVVVEVPGYEPWTERMTWASSETPELRARLVPRPPEVALSRPVELLPAEIQGARTPLLAGGELACDVESVVGGTGGARVFLERDHRAYADVAVELRTAEAALLWDFENRAYGLERAAILGLVSAAPGARAALSPGDECPGSREGAPEILVHDPQSFLARAPWRPAVRRGGATSRNGPPARRDDGWGRGSGGLH